MRNKLMIITACFLCASCGGNYTPKPAGYPRIDYPEKAYRIFDTIAPFSFEYPVYAVVEEDRDGRYEPYWYNIRFPGLNGVIHLSYKPVQQNLNSFIEDSRALVYKHTSRSDGIDEIPLIDTADRKFGILYDLKGDVASSVQFFVTDSTDHFLRGSLYFNTEPNRDSLYPVIQFVREDIVHLIETVEWKYFIN